MRRYCLFFFACLSLFIVRPQSALWAQGTFQEAEDSLNVLAGEMFTSIIPDGKMNAGLSFGKLLYQTLQEPGSFQYGFDSLGKQIHILYSDDKRFRVFNWLVSPDENITRYYGIIQTADAVYPLINYSDRLVQSSTFLKDTLDRKHWFGAEYYKLLSRRSDGTDYYFLLGFNRDGTYSNKKIIDVLFFNADGEPLFGAPLFEFPSGQEGALQTQYRVLWQYKKGAAFYLDYDKDRKVIAFDNLHSRVNNPLRKNTYVPTSQIDGLTWKGGRWVYTPNVVTPMKLKDGQAPVNGVIQK